MFPHQQMAASLLPSYIFVPVGCRVCTATCYDTGCAYSWGCGLTHTPVEMAQAAVVDPALQLAELRKGLELQIAGVEAQQRVLRERSGE